MRALVHNGLAALTFASSLAGGLQLATSAEPAAKVQATALQERGEAFYDPFLIPSEQVSVDAAGHWTPGDACIGCLPPTSMMQPGTSSMDSTPSTAGGISSSPSGMPQASAPAANFGSGVQGGSLMASRDVPAMFGDFFGSGGFAGIGSAGDFPYAFFLPDAGAGGAAAAVGRVKLAENTSPIPRDRVFLNYSYFSNVPIFPGDVDVHRLTPGFEKTFLDNLMSFELRVPMAKTLGADSQVIDGNGSSGPFGSVIGDTSTGELGNLTMYLKASLWEGRDYLISTGLGVALPTADDLTVTKLSSDPVNPGATVLRFENESVHLLPFLGGVYAPNDRFFASGILQFDFDTTGNGIFEQPVMDPFGQPIQLGVLQDQTYMFLDASIGYWLFHNRSGGGFLTGVAPVFEVHYNQSLGNTDYVVFQSGTPTNTSEVSIVNLVFGLNLELAQNANIQVGYTAPVYGKPDEQFDGELRVMFNWLFGRSSSRLQRTPVYR